MAQQYFKMPLWEGKPFEKKTIHFPNGDLLMAGTPVEGLSSGTGSFVYMVKMDKCGRTLWSNSYRWRSYILEFKDFEINAASEVYVYGSAYRNDEEYVFLLKLDTNGNIIAFRLFHGGTIDRFTYSIDLQGDRILAYGLLLDWSTPKHGFVAYFDENLEFLWGKKFVPFESFGDGIFTPEGGFIGRSGRFMVKLDSSGNLIWANELQSASNDRWGGRVFESGTTEDFWSGESHGKPAAQGIYLVSVDYQLTDVTGEIQRGSLVQDVLLMK